MKNHHNTIKFKKIISSSLCHRPWTRLQINSSGNFTPCCSYGEVYKNEKGEPYNITKDKISDVIKSKYLKDLKRKLIDNEYPKNCSKCWHDEKIESLSERVSAWNEEYFSGQHNVFKNKDYFTSLHIEWTNKCNLKCRICNFKFSTTWGNELIKHSNLYQIPSNLIKEYNKKANWDKDNNLIQKIKGLLPTIKVIENTGGEPLSSKAHENFLYLILKEGHAHKIELRYNTNGTHYPEKIVKELWPKFKKTKIRFSIDDIGKRFEYQRHPAIWDKVVANIDKFKNNNLKNQTLEIYSAISILNICYIDELYKFVKTFDNIYWNIAVLKFPNEFCIRNLSNQNKLALLKRLIKINEQPEIQEIINELNFEHNLDVNWKEKFIAKIRMTDKIRGEDFRTTFPELWELIQ